MLLNEKHNIKHFYRTVEFISRLTGSKLPHERFKLIALDEYKAVNVAVESSDTILEIDNDNCIKSIPQRKYLRRVQTPQGFDLQIIKKAHELALQKKDLFFTDDCGLVKEFDLAKIKVIEGEEFNIKITYPSDIKIAKNIIDVCDKI